MPCQAAISPDWSVFTALALAMLISTLMRGSKFNSSRGDFSRDADSSALSKAVQGLSYKWPNEPGVSKNFDGCIQLMKNYVNARGNYLNTRKNSSKSPVCGTEFARSQHIVALHFGVKYEGRLFFRIARVARPGTRFSAARM